MTEHNTTPASTDWTDSSAGKEKNTSSAAWKLSAGLAGLALLVIGGMILSLVLIFRGDDAEPLVSLDQGATGTGSEIEDGLFQPDPVFDQVNRVVYVPLDSKGVLLSETTAGGSRPADQEPSGVMLQRIHGNMDLPFSTSDGPTGFTDNGVATGFSRTAQGAALAAAHYFGYVYAGQDRLEMLDAAGRLSDPKGEFSNLGSASNTPSSVMPMVKVLFNPDLALVKFGYTAEMTDGSTKIVVSKIPMVWREGTEWVLQADSTALGVEYEPLPADGWHQWW